MADSSNQPVRADCVGALTAVIHSLALGITPEQHFRTTAWLWFMDREWVRDENAKEAARPERVRARRV